VCKKLFYFTEKSFTEYTNNNISEPHVLSGSDLNFTYQEQSRASSYDLKIFLMVNNHSIVSGDMYYIQMSGSFSSDRNKIIQNVQLIKCTSLTNNERISLPGESAQRGCNVHSVSIVQLWFYVLICQVSKVGCLLTCVSHPQAVDGEDLQIWRTAVNVFNMRLWTACKGWCFNLGVGRV
jgi:hypothetical protein